MIGSSLNASLENVTFTDRSEELCTALENGIGKNTSITEMSLINMRFSDRLIDSVGKGLKANKTLKMLNLQGNLMVWNSVIKS